jgi:2-dehydro-3-deoxygalactonokinase
MSTIEVFGDWGTTRLRLFRMRDGAVVQQVDGAGIGALTIGPKEELERALRKISASDKFRVFICGMAGARNALLEAPYVDCPARVDAWRGACVRLRLPNAEVSIAPGLACTNDAGAPDVMRGEETQIFGAMAIDPELARETRVIVLPGTHSKWVIVRNGVIVSFKTFVTGELFGLLKSQSMLSRVSVSAGADYDDVGFSVGLRRADEDPDLLGALFTARSAQLSEGRSASWAMSYISGLLIGHEIRAGGPLESVTLIGAGGLTDLYRRAFDERGVDCSVLVGDECSVAGLTLLAQKVPQYDFD